MAIRPVCPLARLVPVAGGRTTVQSNTPSERALPLSIFDQFSNFARSESIAILSRTVVIQVIGYGLSLALMPLAIAFYTPVQFGMFGVYLFCANLIATFGGMKLEWALINEHSTRVADLQLKFSLTLLACWGLTMAVAALGAPQAVYVHFGLDRWAAVLAAAIAVVTGFGLFMQSWGIRAKNYQSIYLSRNAVMVSRQMVLIGFGLAWPSVFALLLAEFASRLLGIRIILHRLGKRIEFIAPARFVRLFQPLAFGRYGPYSKVGLPSSLVDFLTTEGLPVLIVSLHGVEVAGAYWLLQRIFGIPVALVGTVIADVFQGQIARRREHEMIFQQMTQVGIVLTGFSLTVLPAAALAFWVLTQHLYGGRWMLSGQLALYLIPAICSQFIASPLSRVLIVREKMNYKYVFDGITLLGLAIWLALTDIGGLTPLSSMACLAAAQTVASCVYITLCLHVARQARV
jgi:hypothetical protein